MCCRLLIYETIRFVLIESGAQFIFNSVAFTHICLMKAKLKPSGEIDFFFFSILKYRPIYAFSCCQQRLQLLEECMNRPKQWKTTTPALS